MGWKRDIFSGELVETLESGQGRQVIFRGSLPYGEATVRGRRGDPWDTGRDHVALAMSIKPEEATPERIAHENKMAKRHGTGAYYTPDGRCHTPTRGSRAKEMRRPHRGGFRYQDNDAGYGDYAGR